jgi:hypothetical protein
MKRRIVAFVAVAGLAALFLPALSVGDAESDDPVLDFYCNRARVTAGNLNPIERGTAFSFDAVTYYKRIGRRGKVDLVDSTRSTYYYSFGKLDSLTTDTSASSRDYEVDLSYPNVFDGDYIFSFYPNDTGGADLAIGFDTDTAVAGEPVGIAIIDRSRFFLKWLYLHYPDRKGYKRYSHSLRFTERDGLVFPDSIWTVAAKAGLFSSEFYRLETGISNLVIER